MSLGKRGSAVQRDGSSFTLLRFNTKTNSHSIEKSVIGAAKAELEHKVAMRDLTKQEIEEGWTWLLKANSRVARDRLAFGFQPGRN